MPLMYHSLIYYYVCTVFCYVTDNSVSIVMCLRSNKVIVSFCLILSCLALFCDAAGINPDKQCHIQATKVFSFAAV